MKFLNLSAWLSPLRDADKARSGGITLEEISKFCVIREQFADNLPAADFRKKESILHFLRFVKRVSKSQARIRLKETLNALQKRHPIKSDITYAILSDPFTAKRYLSALEGIRKQFELIGSPDSLTSLGPLGSIQLGNLQKNSSSEQIGQDSAQQKRQADEAKGLRSQQGKSRCPHCNEDLPFVGDAFCTFCHEPLS